jgi:hypothetical protein
VIIFVGQWISHFIGPAMTMTMAMRICARLFVDRIDVAPPALRDEARLQTCAQERSISAEDDELSRFLGCCV